MRRLSGEKCFFGENVLPEFITLWFPHRWVEMGGAEEQVLEKAAVAVDKVEDFFKFCKIRETTTSSIRPLSKL